MTYDKNCWLECMKLGDNGTDSEHCKLRPDEGLGAIGELSPGSIYTPASTSVFTNMVKYLSNLGYIRFYLHFVVHSNFILNSL